MVVDVNYYKELYNCGLLIIIKSSDSDALILHKAFSFNYSHRDQVEKEDFLVKSRSPYVIIII